MSSITITNKKTIVLFQGGLGDTGGGFSETIERLIRKSSKMIKSNVFLDMKAFNVTQKAFFGLDSSGYLVKQNALAMEFNERVASIVAMANANPNKSILVRTSLSESIDSISSDQINYLGFDSVMDQATKLVYIIDTIKKIDNTIKIILVGHSQGGLVDLEVATRIPYKVEKMVSISTPYSPVYLAKKLMHINFLASIFKKDVYSMLESNSKLARKYRDRVEDLGTSDLYDDIKQRWKNLSRRPSLIVVAGVSGHLSTYIPGVSTLESYTPDTISKYPFDGLVTISEQTSIDYANIMGLSDPNLECYDSKDYLKSPCYFQQGFYFSCKRACCLTSFNLTSTLLSLGISAVKKLIDSWVDGTKFDFNLEEFDIVNDIFNGVNGNPISNPDNQKYYNVYRSDYSHQNLRYCDETIGNLIAIFNA